MTATDPVRHGEAEAIDASVVAATEGFGLRFRGHISVPKDGIYSFRTRSVGGSVLWIGDERVVDNDGVHGLRERVGRLGLKAGYHPIRVEYFCARGEKMLEVDLSGPGVKRGPIPALNLYR
ncbi:MAG: hypothetical protein GY711_19070 [bacterium]|nr:hypothetical protein [bacterium]